MNKKSIVIIGAGITGLPIALNFCKKGYDVTILEKNPFVGGIATSIKTPDGYTMDIGPHYVTLPVNSKFTDEISDMVGKESIKKLSDNIQNDRQVYFQGEYWNGFPSIPEYFKKLNQKTRIKLIFDFGINKLKKKLGFFNNNDVKDYLISNYGKILYDNWFVPYYENLYGINFPSLDLVKNQFKETEMKKLLSSYKKSIANSKNNSIEREQEFFNCYFLGGMISLISGYEKKIRSMGGNIVTNADISSIDHNVKKKIIYKSNNLEKALYSDIVVYALPLNIASKWFQCKTKNSKDKILNGILVFLFVDLETVYENWIIDFYDKESIFWRISQPTHLSKTVAPKDKSIITIEIRASDENELWKLDNQEILKLVKKELTRIKLFDIGKIENSKIIKLKDLYPSNPELINNDYIKKIIEQYPGEYVAGTEIDFGSSPGEFTEMGFKSENTRLGGVFRAILNAQKISQKIDSKN